MAWAADLLLVGAAVDYTQVGKTFLPTMDEADLIVGIDNLPSISLEKSAEINLMIHRALMEAVPEVTRIVARAGSDESASIRWP